MFVSSTSQKLCLADGGGKYIYNINNKRGVTDNIQLVSLH